LHFAFALLCFGIALLLRLLCKLPGSPGEVKNTGGDCHTAQLVAFFPLKRGKATLCNQLVSPSSMCTWVEPGAAEMLRQWTISSFCLLRGQSVCPAAHNCGEVSTTRRPVSSPKVVSAEKLD
jgi:hypothetical protein